MGSTIAHEMENVALSTKVAGLMAGIALDHVDLTQAIVVRRILHVVHGLGVLGAVDGVLHSSKVEALVVREEMRVAGVQEASASRILHVVRNSRKLATSAGVVLCEWVDVSIVVGLVQAVDAREACARRRASRKLVGSAGMVLRNQDARVRRHVHSTLTVVHHPGAFAGTLLASRTVAADMVVSVAEKEAVIRTFKVINLIVDGRVVRGWSMVVGGLLTGTLR